ncbi:LytR/AlgR family response regulator transcription factor [Fluviicola taffensis]|uniref:Two component transcriptional regulator, LytTR family n=1 Tax=Fluviicola taffensis (strain DSM 16823 / NCIMB 13979 / RW262) TaxID=755732 RepID=F2IHI1_FLUTR|nr:LytTR family DNA-binding domain-containing protein [Fluviicola taffensis]AEA43746.1 two component transcriptional regulator, LytTR family [Fluviicola taffensis DSM 16823]
MKGILIDDSPQARKLLRLMLQELAPKLEIVAELEDAQAGLSKVKELKPDVVFLDIEMPGKSGLQLAEELVQNGCQSALIFTTAYNAYAINAFRLSAVDYLLKPIQEDQLLEAISKVNERLKFRNSDVQLQALSKNLKAERPDVLCIPIQGGYEYLSIKEILFLEADGSYVRIVCTNGKHKLVSKNLKYFENAMQGVANFVRVHRSYSVNMDEVAAYVRSDGGNLELRSGKVIPVSRERKPAVLKYLNLD